MGKPYSVGEIILVYQDCVDYRADGSTRYYISAELAEVIQVDDDGYLAAWRNRGMDGVISVHNTYHGGEWRHWRLFGDSPSETQAAARTIYTAGDGEWKCYTDDDVRHQVGDAIACKRSALNKIAAGAR